MVTSPYERKILEWDEKTLKNQIIEQGVIGIFLFFIFSGISVILFLNWYEIKIPNRFDGDWRFFRAPPPPIWLKDAYLFMVQIL